MYEHGLFPMHSIWIIFVMSGERGRQRRCCTILLTGKNCSTFFSQALVQDKKQTKYLLNYQCETSGNGVLCAKVVKSTYNFTNLEGF